MLFNYYKSNAWMVLWWLTYKSTLYWFHANINLKYRYKTPFFLKSFPSTNNNNCYCLEYWFCKFFYQWMKLSFIVYFVQYQWIIWYEDLQKLYLLDFCSPWLIAFPNLINFLERVVPSEFHTWIKLSQIQTLNFLLKANIKFVSNTLGTNLNFRYF